MSAGSGRAPDPSLDFCDLCGATTWRIFMVGIPDELMSPRLRQAIRRRRPAPGAWAVMTVPLCEACADLLDFASSRFAEDGVNLDREISWSPGHRVGPAAEAALARLLALYENQFGNALHLSSPPHVRSRP